MAEQEQVPQALLKSAIEILWVYPRTADEARAAAKAVLLLAYPAIRKEVLGEVEKSLRILFDLHEPDPQRQWAAIKRTLAALNVETPERWKVGQILRHPAGSEWELLRHIGGEDDDWFAACVTPGPGADLAVRCNRSFHREYMDRTFTLEDQPSTLDHDREGEEASRCERIEGGFSCSCSEDRYVRDEISRVVNALVVACGNLLSVREHSPASLDSEFTEFKAEYDHAASFFALVFDWGKKAPDEWRSIELVETMDAWGASKDQEGIEWLTCHGRPVLNLRLAFQHAAELPGTGKKPQQVDEAESSESVKLAEWAEEEAARAQRIAESSTTAEHQDTSRAYARNFAAIARLLHSSRPETQEVLTLTEQLDGSLKLSPHQEGFAMMTLVRATPEPSPEEARCGGDGILHACTCRPGLDGGGWYHAHDCKGKVCPDCPDCNPDSSTEPKEAKEEQ